MSSLRRLHPRIKKFKKHAIITTALLFILFLEVGGTLFYMYFEGWRAIDALYFTTITLTTIGFGDHVPSRDISKLFTIFFAFAGVGTALFSMGLVSEHYFRDKVAQIQGLEDKMYEAMMNKKLKKKVAQIRADAERIASEKARLAAKERQMEREEKAIAREKAKIKEVVKKI